MQTILSSATKQVIISHDRPTVMIGERINPSGKKKFAEALQNGNFAEIVRREAREQVAAGAAVLDVNVGVGGVDEVAVLPEVVKIVMDEVDVPLCIDSGDPKALESALKVYQGKPLVNSVNGEEHSLQHVLPLVKQHGAAVIALLKDETGIPADPESRLVIADKIVNRCAQIGIPLQDIIFDCLALSVAVDSKAVLVTLETIRRIKDIYGANITLGASNVSFGLPGREVINASFLSVAIVAGLTCPVVNAAKARKSILTADLILGKDRFARSYIKYFRENPDLF